MPRMDLHMPPDILRELQAENLARIARYENVNYSYGLPLVARDDESRVYPFDLHYGCAFPSSYSPRTPCSCWRNYRREGCTDCRPELWQQCTCGQHFPRGGECECFVSCEECGERGSRYNFTDPGDSAEYFCGDDCLESAGYSECSECDNRTRNDSGLCDSCTPCECGDCWDCRNRTGIRSYSYKPDPIFHGTGPVFLGLECEVNTGDSRDPLWRIARDVSEAIGRLAYLKSDSSIGKGFELVTHPMSYRHALDSFPWGIFRTLTNDYGVEEDDRCGIHVHVNRDAFSGPGHLYRWQKFIYRNERAVQAIARRTSDEWAAFRPSHREAAALVAKTGGQGGYFPPDAWYRPKGHSRHWAPERYSAINLQNSATLEVRVFAGSLKPVEIQSALGLVNGSVEYTRTLDAGTILKKGGWDFRAFADWTSGKADYASLNSEIQKRVSL